MAMVTGKKKKRYDGDLTPEELAQAIALYRAQQGIGNEDEEEEAHLDADEVINGVRERKDRRDSEAEQLDAEEVIAEQKSDIEALLNVIDELQAASDMTSLDEGDPEANLDEGDPDENADEGNPEENLDDDGDKPMNADSVDKAIRRGVREYLEVCRIADRLNLDGVDDLDLKSARIKVIKKVNPKINLDGKSDAYISAAFDIAKQGMAEKKRPDDQRRRMMSSARRGINTDAADTSSAAAAREKMIARMKGEK